MQTNEEDPKITVEASIFWSKIAEYLPKSIERSALGDEKIYNAFYQAYTEFRPVLLSLQKQQMIEKGEGLKKHEAKIPIPEIRGDSYRMGYNKAITDYQNLIKE